MTHLNQPSVAEVAALLRQIREVQHLDVEDPYRLCVMAEKKRILALIAQDKEADKA